MANQTKTSRRPISPAGVHVSVDALASRALSLVARRNSETSAQFNQAFSDRLHDAAASLSDETVADVVAEMRATGTPAEAIADLYVPHVARQMGDEWCEDSLSFARVTIGTARLQSALHSLGDEWSSLGYSSRGDDASKLIVIIVQDSTHTLGAVVLCGQLRRLGLSVRLAIGPSQRELQKILRSSPFQAALISASESEALESVRDVVDTIRSASETCPPIIVGGKILDLEDDVQAATGADFVTQDLFEALDHCGLMKNNMPKKPQPERQD